MNIKELAKKLNLSITTVSRGLHNHLDVSQKTKEKIRKYAKKYNYKPNPFASGLASRNPNNLGIVIPLYGLNYSPLNHTSFIQFLSGMKNAMDEENIQFSMLLVKSEKEEMDAYKKLIIELKVKNIIIRDLAIKDKRIPLLKKHNINFIAWGRTQNLKNYAWVDLDNHQSMKIILEHLIKKNHKEIAFININKKFNFAYQRMEAYFDFLKEKNQKINKNYYFEIERNDPEISRDVIIKLLKKQKKITALICCTEYIAAGAIKACSKMNIKIGKDLSIITYDSLIVSNLIHPELTSISHPNDDLGYNAVRILMDKKLNIKDKNYLAKAEIIDRGSVLNI